MRELPVIVWERDAQGELVSVSPEIEGVLGYTQAQILNMHRRRHTLLGDSAEGFEQVFREERQRQGETSARIFKADLIACDGSIVPCVLLLIFIRENGCYAGTRSYGCPLRGWLAMPNCCREVLGRLASAVAEEHREVVRLAAA